MNTTKNRENNNIAKEQKKLAIEELAKKLENEMRAEAAERLAIVKPNNPELVEQFSKAGTVYLQDFSPYIKEEDRLRKANEAEMKIVHYMENKQGNLPYLIVKIRIEYRVLYDFLFVSYDKRNWRNERFAIQKLQRQQYGKPYREPEVFEINTELVPKNEAEPIDMRFKRFTTLKLDLD